MGELWDEEVLPCAACNGGHQRWTWHALGMVCARCGEHTGNNHQGHYWGRCKVTGTVRELHFCCPGDCELEAAPAPVRAETNHAEEVGE